KDKMKNNKKPETPKIALLYKIVVYTSLKSSESIHMYFVAISNPNKTITINNITEIINLENRFKNCTICSSASSDINYLLPLLLSIDLLPSSSFIITELSIHYHLLVIILKKKTNLIRFVFFSHILFGDFNSSFNHITGVPCFDTAPAFSLNCIVKS